MKFKATKIAVAVAAGLGVSAAGMNAAQSAEVLFPYFISSTTVTTLFSVINNDDSFGTTTAERLHYRYYHKFTDAGACQEVDYREKTSPNDIVTFDVGAAGGDPATLGVFFEPVSERLNAKYDRDFAPFRDPSLKPVIGFAVVDNNDVFGPGVDIQGEAFIVEFATGSVWGYKAYSPSEIWSYNPANGVVTLQNPYDFSDRVETTGEVMVQRPTGGDPKDYWVPIAIMPFSQVTTRLFVTPIGVNTPFQLRGDLNARVGLRVNDPGNAVFDVMYDRDENPVSGQVDASVTCVGRVEVANLMTTAAKNRVPNGGWSNVAVGSGSNTDQATVLKLEFNPSSAATLDDLPIGGSFNNGFWVRKGIRESLARSLSFGGWNILPLYQIPGIELSSPYAVFNEASVAAAGLPLPPVQTIASSSSVLSAVEPATSSLSDYYNTTLYASTADVAAAISAGKTSIKQ